MSAPRGESLARAYIELLSEFQRASTFVPTEPMTAIAATTIRPAISAYSRTSPPCSSRASFATRFFIAFMTVLLRRLRCAQLPAPAARPRREPYDWPCGPYTPLIGRRHSRLKLEATQGLTPKGIYRQAGAPPATLLS